MECDPFVQEVVDKKLQDKEKLWQAVNWIPDLQSAWQVLLQCAGPRCHHVIRTVPPNQPIEYARRHDEGMEQTMGALLGGLPGEQRAKNKAQQIGIVAHCRMGRIGVEISETHMAHGAYWASWADALEMIHERVPQSGRKSHCAITTRRGLQHWVSWRIKGGQQPRVFSDDSSGMICAGECDLLPIIRMSQASGHMDGNTTRPLLPNSSFVRP